MYRLRRFNKINAKAAVTSAKPPYLIFNPHSGACPLAPEASVSKLLGREGQTFLQIMAVDPGIANCGLRIERRWSDGTVETVMLVRIDFKTRITSANNGMPLSETGDGGNIDTLYYTEVPKILDPYVPHFEMCQYIVVESQLGINYDLIRMGQHLLSYLMIRLANRGSKPLIIEIDSRFKTRMMQAPAKFESKTALKKWTTNRALELLVRNRDQRGLETMNSCGAKKDDLGDVIVYCEAWSMICSGQLHKPPSPAAPVFDVRPVPKTSGTCPSSSAASSSVAGTETPKVKLMIQPRSIPAPQLSFRILRTPELPGSGKA